MSLPLRDESPGYHHVVARGNNKRTIYIDDHDRLFFCLTVERIARKYGWTVLAYCLMPNHYHLLLWVGEDGLSRGMCELNTSYAVTFNARHGRVNHLFGRRFWNRKITTHAATIGLAFADIELARDQLLAFFGSTPAGAIEAFRVYCSAGSLGGPVSWQPP